MASLWQHGALTRSKTRTWSRTWLRLFIGAAVLTAMGTLTPGSSSTLQAAEVKAPDAIPTIDLDVLSLLISNQVFTEKAEDAIWQITPGSGRNLVQVPLMVEEGKEDFEFGSMTVRLGSARFLAWRVVEPNTDKAEANSDAAREIEASLVDMPTFTRKFTLTSRGRVQWKMDRFILGGSIKPIDLAAGNTGRLYAFRISPKILSDMSPTQPKLTRGQGEDSMSYYGRTALANNQFRSEREAYTQLRKEVGELPDEFDIKAPRRIWGVYDMLVFEREMKLTGLSEPDWRINLDALKILREACTLRVSNDNKLDSNYLGAIVTVGKDSHPYNQRLAAYTIALSGAASQVTFNDQLYQLMGGILAGGDSTAKRVVIKELASVIPPNTATLTLLKNVASSDLDPRSRMETLKGMLNTDFSLVSPQSRDAIATINTSLSNPQGPPPADVLEQVLVSSKDKPDAINMLAAGIRFSDLPDDRLNKAIIFVVENAGSHPLAARWLDEQFLGALDPKVVHKTFEVIASADAGAQTLGPAISTGLAAIFGKAKAAEGETTRPATARISSPILVPGTNHAIFRALRSSDPKIRQLAWQALPNFVFNELPPDEDPNASTERSGNRYQTMLDIALQQSPTPPGAITFLARQPDKGQAAVALVQIILRGSSQGSALASRSLLTLNTPLEVIVNNLPFGERAGLATRLYENLQGRAAPLSVNLLRQRIPNNPVAVWFAKEISQGNLPSPASWATAVTNEEGLVELITSSDPDVGIAAMAALVYRTGGGDREARILANRFRNMADQSTANVTAEWAKAKRELYLQQFRDLSGPYKLILLSDGVEHTLAVVQFQSDGSTISFGNQAITLSIPEDRLGIRIDKPSELKSLNTMPELANLQIDDAIPAELTRKSAGEWSGSIAGTGINPAPQLIMRSVLGR